MQRYSETNKYCCIATKNTDANYTKWLIKRTKYKRFKNTYVNYKVNIVR